MDGGHELTATQTFPSGWQDSQPLQKMPSTQSSSVSHGTGSWARIMGVEKQKTHRKLRNKTLGKDLILAPLEHETSLLP